MSTPKPICGRCGYPTSPQYALCAVHDPLGKSEWPPLLYGDRDLLVGICDQRLALLDTILSALTDREIEDIIGGKAFAQFTVDGDLKPPTMRTRPKSRSGLYQWGAKRGIDCNRLYP